MPRIYKRKFDWDEAQRLHDDEGLNCNQIARRLGVSYQAVYRVLVPGAREKDKERAAAWVAAGTCSVCGATASRAGFAGDAPRCRDCARKAATTSVDRERGLVRCQSCREWLSPDSFAKTRKRRGFAQECRDCNTARKREWRDANRDKLRAYDRERKRQQRRRAVAA